MQLRVGVQTDEEVHMVVVGNDILVTLAGPRQSGENSDLASGMDKNERALPYTGLCPKRVVHHLDFFADRLFASTELQPA